MFEKNVYFFFFSFFAHLVAGSHRLLNEISQPRWYFDEIDRVRWNVEPIRMDGASRNTDSLLPNLGSFPRDLFVFSMSVGEEVCRRSTMLLLLLLDQQEAIEQAWRNCLHRSGRKNIDCQSNYSSFLFLVCQRSLNSMRAWLAFVTHISSTSHHLEREMRDDDNDDNNRALLGSLWSWGEKAQEVSIELTIDRRRSYTRRKMIERLWHDAIKYPKEGNVVQRLKRIITCRESKEKCARQATAFIEGRSRRERERRTERTGEREREEDRIRGVDRYSFAHWQWRKSVNVSVD